MNRRHADVVVGLLVATVLVVGSGLSWQAYQQNRALDRMMGGMMGPSMGSVHGPNPLWYVLGTLLVAVVVVGLYLVVREDRPVTDVSERSEQRSSEVSRPPTTEPTEETDGESKPAETVVPEERDQPETRVLDLLPNDERRILEPVLTSPGITQIELRDRSNFSKSKVSQTVSTLEKRGLLYRERQGRTFRIYPSEELRQRQS